MIFANQDILTNAHNDNPVVYVADGGKITNSGANFNFIQNVTLKNGANIYASNGNTSWEAYKIQNIRVERSGDAGFADDLLSHVQSYYFTDLEYIQLDNSYGEKYNGKFAIRGTVDSSAVPEPSTWSLLVLGVSGLLYLRKRTN